MHSRRSDIGPKVIVALDFQDAKEALRLATRLDPRLCRVKVGFELYVAVGPSIIESLQQLGFDVFLDLKFHDIPNTVASACRAAAALGVWMVNVHASGGIRMMQAAREALNAFAAPPLLIAVTVLTSMDGMDLQGIGVTRTAEEQVYALAALAHSCGLSGVVCSAQETASLRRRLGPDFVLVTPGIRPEGSGNDDQKRVLTPMEAIKQGANYLVVGRPITRASEPLDVLHSIVGSLP